MSFIFENKKLIQTLVEVGDEAIQKQAQNTRTNAAPVSDYELAQKLLFNLQRELGDPQAPAAGMPLGVEGGAGDINLTANTANFRTLGDFLNWAIEKKITWKGKRFAWDQSEVDEKRGQPEDPTQKAWVFTSMSFNRNDRSVDRQPNTVRVYADKDALVEFLSALRDSPEASNNKVLSFMLSSLIGEVNRYLRIAGQKPIDPKPSAKPQEFLNSDLIVDVVPDILDLENFDEGLDNHPFQNIEPDSNNALTVKDLKDEGTFKYWLRNKKVKVTISSQGNQSTKVVGATDPKGDPCLAVHILYKRALYLKNVAAGDDKIVPNYSKAVALYLQSVTTFGKNILDKDGKPCAVTTTGTIDPASQQQQQQQQRGTTGTNQVQQMLYNVVRLMPLRSENFDFSRIQAFFRAYEALLQGSNSSQLSAVQEFSNRVATSRQEISGLLNDSGMFNFNLGVDPSTVAQWVKPPAFRNYVPFVQKLMSALDATQSAISMFYSEYADPRITDKLRPDQQQLVAGQFMGNSYYQRNRDDMEDWLHNSDKITGVSR